MLKIIYQDNDLLVIDKPPGLVVDPAETVKQETLADILQKDFGIKLFRGGIVHRLDKDTSGIILVAKTQKTLENLQAQFKERKIQKEYLALVHGHIMESGVVNASISRNPNKRENFIAVSSGQRTGVNVNHLRGDLGWHLRDAITEYEPLERLQVSGDRLQEIFSDFNKIQFRKLSTVHYNLFTLLICKPLTGRTHQIRVHLKYIGHPIVSDQKYVGRKMYRLDKRWCPRMFLHAKKLGFYHPGNGKWMEVESKLPEDLSKVLDSLRSLEQ